jgi:hypothetical protein
MPNPFTRAAVPFADTLAGDAPELPHPFRCPAL